MAFLTAWLWWCQAWRGGQAADSHVDGMLPQVITPSSGGPAERAGIEPQDILIAIGDRPMQNVSLYEAGDLLQGSEGTEVR